MVGEQIILPFMKALLCFGALITAMNISAQDSLKKPLKLSEETFKNSPGEMKIRFDESGDKFLKFGISSQVWLRGIDNNPGTQVNGVPQDFTYDAGVRRMRIIMNAQMSSWLSVMLQFGINNQSFISGGGSGTGGNGAGKKPQIFFMDAYNEVTIKPMVDKATKTMNKNHLYIGAGLHAWSGISRLTNASTTKLLTADLPVFNFPNIEVSDQFSRQFGVFAHGAFNKFNYRVSVNKPFATNRTPIVGGPVVENNQSGKLSFAGYGMYQFGDRETTATSFLPGTYIGSKKIFNIGLGFYSNNDATLEQPTEGQMVSHNQSNFGLDVFVDRPIGNPAKEMAVSFYSVYYLNDYGHNYLRTTGIMNPGTADPTYTGAVAAEGFGNAKYLLGTGKIWYTQAGFVLPKFSDKVKLQPFASYTLKDFDALNQIGHHYDIGANLFILSQNAKLAYQYTSRPLYNAETKEVFTRKGEHLLTLQIAL